MKEVWGPDAREIPGYREAMIDIAVCMNAAQSAFDLRQEVERAAKWEIEVLYGVFSLHNHQVSMPVTSAAASRSGNDQKIHGSNSDGLLLTRDDHLGMERPN